MGLVVGEKVQLPSVLTDAREKLLPSVVRTVVPAVVGWLLSVAFVAKAGRALGITEGQWEQAVTSVLTVAWFVLWRAVELWVWPRLGAFLLGLGVGSPVYQPKHRAATGPDAGSARLGVPVLLTVAALAVVLAVPAVPASAASRGPVLPVVTVAGDCDGTLVVAFNLMVLRGRHLTPVLDDGRNRLELLEVSGRSQPGGHWTPVDASSGGEGRLRWPGYRRSGTEGSHWQLARVVRTDRDRVVSLPAAITPGCVA